MSKKEAKAWINFQGGDTEALILSSVLKAALDADGSNLYGFARRTHLTRMMQKHPAITEIGFVPKDAEVIDISITREECGPGEKRLFQQYAKKLGLKLPVEEKLFIGGGIAEDPILHKMLPFKEKNVMIAPFTSKTERGMHPMAWQKIVDKLTSEGMFVVQVGGQNVPPMRGAYALRGIMNSRQIISLIDKVDLVITPEAFSMHAAKLTGTPAVVLWGKSTPEAWGYEDMQNLLTTEFPKEEEAPQPAMAMGGPGGMPGGPGQPPKKMEPYSINVDTRDVINAVKVYL